AIIKKEFFHILRDPRSLMIILLMPLLQIFIFGYAVDIDLKNIPMAVVDGDRSEASRRLVSAFVQSGHFEVRRYVARGDDFERLFRAGKIKGGLVIPRGFEPSIATRLETPVQVIVDGSDGNVGQTILHYSEAVLMNFSANLAANRRQALVEVRPRFWYNESLESANFIVPGLAAIILMMISALLTSLAIAREKETGTLEQLLAAPVHPMEIIVGKIIPYVALALLDGLLILAAGLLIFGVPFHGSPALLLWGTLIYLYPCLALGLLVSTFARTQQFAMMLALVLTILPSVMLSGFIFPVASMPRLHQFLSTIIPATYYLQIIRGILLKGAGAWILAPQGLALLAIGTILLVVAVKNFKVKVG
ncbi:MAG: ABC transporter permease, partial [Calditrichaeota bacterium]|nr:ABC transporter permease [Calditrichota bacterium]